MTTPDFSWIETHEQISDYLLTKEHNQIELITLLKKAGATIFQDQEVEGQFVEMKEIDPFTFFCYIYKYGSDKRLSILQKIAKEIHVKAPTGESGVPSSNAQKVWLFPYKFNRNNNEIQRLWDFFKQVKSNNISNETFADILKIKNIGKTKLTEALFYVDPNRFLPINSPVLSYLKNKFKLDIKFDTYIEYINVLNKVKESIKLPFYELSYQAWLVESKKTIDINYWVFQANPKYYDTELALKAGVLKTWRVSQFKKEIKTGDKVILWITGDKAGIYALATVNSEVHKINDVPEEIEFYIDKTDMDKEVDGVELELEYNLANSPIFKDNILTHPILKGLKQGIRGTNLKATEKEYNEILKLIDNMSYYNELIKFLQQAKTTELKTSHYLSNYLAVKVKVSFGQGGLANVPWISFLRDGQTTQNGIYPVYLFYKDIDLLILAYGISETKIPEANWSLVNPKSIINYFSENNLGFPFRYGKSYVFKAYNTNELPQKDTLDKDLLEIVNYYKSIHLKEITQKTPIETINFNHNSFIQSIFDSHLFFTENLITRFASSLLTKPFVILTGLSGSGKTKLAQAFAMWISENETQYKIVPVGADWTNREPLLGYPNALQDKAYVRPDSGVLDLILAAKDHSEKPYFLILDEMNLSHVERYFADFLSTMESGNEVLLHAGDEDWEGVPAKICLPKNLFIVGTVNIDETTYMFSPKVLDRANVIEFRVTEAEMTEYLKNSKPLKMDELKGQGAAMGSGFLELALDKELASEKGVQLADVLLKFFTELKKAGAEFGYRSASEIKRFAAVVEKTAPEWTTEAITDAAIMQKLLPKLHGSRRKLEPVLKTLIGLCIAEGAKPEEYITHNPQANVANVLYPVSLEKIQRMYRGLIDNGFTSYAEA